MPSSKNAIPTSINIQNFHNMKLKAWISAFRLRTLPLALASILCGSFLAIESGNFSWNTVILAILTTLLLQILSNLANDYGDGIKGTDNTERLGPLRAIQSGIISNKEMKIAIIVFALLSLFSGIALLISSLGAIKPAFFIFLIIGLSAIAAAIKYTVGKNAYGYSGFGDIFVFIFFGLVAVLGSYYLNTGKIDPLILLPATSIGLFSTAVLNLNNMRDIVNDSNSGKNTLAVKWGLTKAKRYHLILMTLGIVSALAYTRFTSTNLWNYLHFIAILIFIIHLRQIIKIEDESKFDPFLKKTALTTFLWSILFGLGLIL